MRILTLRDKERFTRTNLYLKQQQGEVPSIYNTNNLTQQQAKATNSPSIHNTDKTPETPTDSFVSSSGKKPTAADSSVSSSGKRATPANWFLTPLGELVESTEETLYDGTIQKTQITRKKNSEGSWEIEDTRTIIRDQNGKRIKATTKTKNGYESREYYDEKGRLVETYDIYPSGRREIEHITYLPDDEGTDQIIIDFDEYYKDEIKKQNEWLKKAENEDK